MDFTEYIFALAVIIIGVVRWFIENRNNNEGTGEGRENTDSDLPEWVWPSEKEEQAAPPLPSSPPPPPQRTQAQVPPPLQEVKLPTKPSSSLGSLSALQHKIAEAKKRALQAEAQRIKFSSKTSTKQVKSEMHRPHGAHWLSDPKALRRAIIAREILGPPLALRDDADSEIR